MTGTEYQGKSWVRLAVYGPEQTGLMPGCREVVTVRYFSSDTEVVYTGEGLGPFVGPAIGTVIPSAGAFHFFGAGRRTL